METNDKRNPMKDDELNKIHSDALGLNVPENYFSNSKKEILGKLIIEASPKVIPFYKKRTTWYAAAMITLFLGLTLINNYNKTEQQISAPISDSIAQIENATNPIPENSNSIPNYKMSAENDILISSLFVEDKEIDEYITNYILDDI
ncbi:hypothetical protein [Flavobacterium flavipallidum]|uniref:Uncharacterized protein n=1 Tax=Flavobacterium flavipallidum TaxID=3139140 RepID=A0ABU9HND7_9FLAO